MRLLRVIRPAAYSPEDFHPDEAILTGAFTCGEAREFLARIERAGINPLSLRAQLLRGNRLVDEIWVAFDGLCEERSGEYSFRCHALAPAHDASLRDLLVEFPDVPSGERP